MATWLPLALVDVLAWGFGQAVAKKATVALGPGRMVLLVSFVDGSLWVAFLTLFHGSLRFSPTALAMGLLAGFSGMVGYVLFYESLNHGNVALVGLITGASPLVTVVGALLFLGERLGSMEALGVVFLAGCVLLLSYEPYRDQGGDQARSLTYALLVLGLWGGWGLFTKVAMGDIQATEGPGGEGDVVFFFALANFVVGIGYYLFRRRSMAPSPLPPTSHLVVYTVNSLVLALGILALSFALATGEAALVSAVSGTYPLITVATASLVLRERITPAQWVAAGLFVPGIIMVAF